MKTKLPTKITTVRQAKMLLKKLHTNGESFHPEDDATELVGDIFTQKEGEKLNQLMEDIYNLPGNDGRHNNLAFDPCGFLLDLDAPVKKFQWKDKTGRGFKNSFNLTDIRGMQDDENWDGISLHEWAEEAEEGDEFENATSKYICTIG